ncbi:Dehydrogenase/reductase SDR family member 7 [Habropoda laboriosa]|uniref:Dehydrogenase/reductase SDR family member 7 n=1 Tax=Habropoda laboriosa TaxID=597456 RepID=A0A0L7QUN0_9HYME|nr:PREDICTED: dehydrogenase/reductase SDR family member 7 [Habropoda laboriosa]XP_017793383.1 PREDICTED: dehydrogenase/reductase SDR family member 7 [Habropoda laboriosa]KOC62279.1 Dehydrogenase/reductase SDR family member 7 [Habropoda laboriosa]
MDLLAVIGSIVIVYYLIYVILPWFLDCDLNLTFHEKFGKPISSLKGKVIWIIGASSGIGENLAYVLAEAGCKIILSARRESELNRVKANCLQRNSNLTNLDVEILVLDICDINSHESAFNNIITKFGKLDILVNNAGRSQRAIWEKIDLTVDKDMFNLNVFSQMALSRLIAEYFFKVDEGHFVITSSLAGVIAAPFSATYCGTKYALHGYYTAFNVEKVGKNVSVTIVCPGATQTNFLAEAYTDKPNEKYGENTQEDSVNKISARRCATLMGIAIANKLSEVWISKPLVLQLYYLKVYYPNLGALILRLLGPRYLLRLRDNKTKIKQEQ